MEDKEIKKILKNINIPEPGDEARDRAVKSALTEFRIQKPESRRVDLSSNR